MPAKSDMIPVVKRLVKEGILNEEDKESFGAILGERYIVRKRRKGERRIDYREEIKKMPHKRKEYFAKHDIPELNIKKGKLTKEEFEEALKKVKDLIHTHNTIIGVKMYQDMTYDEAADLVEEVLLAYEAGELDDEGVGDALSP